MNLFQVSLILATIVVVLTVTISNGYVVQSSNEKEITITMVKNMSLPMQNDAKLILKSTYFSHQGEGNRSKVFRTLYAQKYRKFTWHVINTDGFAIQYSKCLVLKVDNNHFLLFATT